MTLLSSSQFMFPSPPIITQSRRYRKQKPSMRLIPNMMLAKPAATTVPKRLFKKLRSYVIPKSAYDMPSPTTPGRFFRNRRYAEKRLYGDSCDYYTDSDDEDGDEDGYIIVPDKRQSRRCVSGEKRAGVGAWEIDSRSMMV